MSHSKWLRQAADEIRAEGHAGWGNTCEQAADAYDSLAAQRDILVGEALTWREERDALAAKLEIAESRQRRAESQAEQILSAKIELESRVQALETALRWSLDRGATAVNALRYCPVELEPVLLQFCPAPETKCTCGIVGPVHKSDCAVYSASETPAKSWKDREPPHCPSCSCGMEAEVKHEVTCKLFPDPFDERDPIGPCTCSASNIQGKSDV